MVMAYKFLKNNKDNAMRDFTHAKKKVVKAVPHKELKGVCDVYDFDYGYRPTPNNEHDCLEYSDYSYLAGLYDAFRIMAVIFPDRWDMDQIQKALSLIEN